MENSHISAANEAHICDDVCVHFNIDQLWSIVDQLLRTAIPLYHFNHGKLMQRCITGHNGLVEERNCGWSTMSTELFTRRTTLMLLHGQKPHSKSDVTVTYIAQCNQPSRGQRCNPGATRSTNGRSVRETNQGIGAPRMIALANDTTQPRHDTILTPEKSAI
ncbi:hypothetical protein EAG_07075 [Camponotus floridanus]|uniref:Uncharacterized protein n=1 Tax=Camponotus floridanus TaxID=104421 RepID=E2AJP7_CAMFO|nr:hypothetical protein EAG_07075 [Camponotus floridanus]